MMAIYMTEPRPQPGPTRDLVTISTAFFFVFLGTGASQPFIVGYLTTEKGLPLEWASLVLAAVYIAFAVFRFFIGFIIDRVGLHAAKILGVAAYALFPVILYLGTSLPVFLVGSILWGLGAPMLWTGSLVQILNVSRPGRYGTHTGIVQGSVMVAVFLGASMLSFVYSRHGYAALLLLAAGLGFVGVGAMAMSPNRSFDREKPDLRKFLELLRSRQAKAVMVFLVCAGLTYGLVLNGFTTYIEARLGKQWLKIILPVFFLAGILTNFIGGRICDRIGRWRTFQWGFLLGAVGMLLAWLLPSPGALALAMLLIGVEFSIVPLSAYAWIGDNTRPADRASVMGYVFCCRDVGVALAIQLRGMIPEVTTAAAVFAIVSLGCALMAVFAGRPNPRRYAEPRPVE
jgi:predicted MFS family arabinose efflux permease